MSADGGRPPGRDLAEPSGEGATELLGALVPRQPSLLERSGPADAGGQLGLRTGSFRKIAEHGFGDPYNAYPHSMAWFRNRLYVGTTRACLAYRGRWRRERSPDLLGQVWPVRIPDQLFDIDLRAEIWRYDPASDGWRRVFLSPMAQGIDGYQVPRMLALRSMTVFQGQSDPAPCLYVPAMGSHQTPDAIMVRSEDGEQFEVVNEPSMGFPEEYRAKGVRALTVFGDRLFTAPTVGRGRKSPNYTAFMIIGVNADPARAPWEIACDPNFGDPYNLTVFEMAVFNGYLYAGTANVREGFQVWKTDAEGTPPYRWTRVISHGAFRGKFNEGVVTMRAFGGHLYVGSGIQEGGWDTEHNVGPAAAEVIRLHPDDSWDLVVGQPRMTPDGLKVPLSGLGPGFDNPFTAYIWSMCEHEGWLYVGTLDTLVLLRYGKPGSWVWPEYLRKQFRAKQLEEMLLQAGGFNLWRTQDGVQWFPVTRNGFGNCYNYGARTLVSAPCGLFVGAANPFGPDVAVKRPHGWRYEPNPDGGLEIWLGSPTARAAARGELRA